MIPIIPITSPAYDSLIDISSQKDDWCFFAKVIRLWKSIERKEHAEVVTTNLVLMYCYAQTIQAPIGRELSAKFANVLREDNVYVMYNFKVELNELEVRTNTHKYILNFTNDTKVKCVHNGFLPIYSYFFTHPNVFLNHKYNPAVLVDVIGMLTNVAVENDYFTDGKMKKIVSMDLTNHGHSFKCILHGRCIDQFNDFLLSGNSVNVVVALFFGKIEIWKGVPVVQNTTTYTKLLFNPKLDATLDLKQRMLGSQFTPYKNMLPMSQDTKEHILDQWVYSNAKSSVSTPIVDPLRALIDFVYQDILQNMTNAEIFQDRCILAPTLEAVEKVNDTLLSLIPGIEKEYYSSDSVSKSDKNDEITNQWFTTEFLNDIKSSGIPNHRLRLKKGCPAMLMRNIDQAAGLCNGTRVTLDELGKNFIGAIVITGKNAWEKIRIPRMNLVPSDPGLPFKLMRRQYPLTLCFSMTINKSQGQSLSHVGIYLPKLVFTHGQLIVDLSSVTSRNGLRLLILNEDGEVVNETVANLNLANV